MLWGLGSGVPVLSVNLGDAHVALHRGVVAQGEEGPDNNNNNNDNNNGR